MTEKQPVTGESLQVAMQAGAGPDGKQWGVLVFAYGPTTWQVALPETNLKEMIQLGPKIEELYNHVKRANLGLIIPTVDPKIGSAFKK